MFNCNIYTTCNILCLLSILIKSFYSNVHKILQDKRDNLGWQPAKGFFYEHFDEYYHGYHKYNEKCKTQSSIWKECISNL